MVIGITGNIGTGKSLVAEFFKEWGAFIISGDQIGWKVLKNPKIKEKLSITFGEEIIKDNDVDRERLGNVVFKDIDKLRHLNKIVHPVLLKKLREVISQSDEDILVVDAALIFEWNIKDWFDYTILTISKLSTIKSRIKMLGISEETIDGILKFQINPDKAKIYADFIIVNNGTERELREKAQKIWNKIFG